MKKRRFFDEREPARLLGWRTRYGRKPEHKRSQTYGRALAIAPKVLTRRSLHQGVRYGK